VSIPITDKRRKLRRNPSQAAADYYEHNAPFPTEIDFPHSTADETVLGYAVTYGRQPKVGVMLGRKTGLSLTIGTFTITVYSTNRPVRGKVDSEHNPLQGDTGGWDTIDTDWDEIGTVTQAELSTIKYFDGPFWALRFKVTAISGYSAGDLVLWVL